jgi:hypothetical protein
VFRLSRGARAAGKSMGAHAQAQEV